MSAEAREGSECADKLLYCVSDEATERALQKLNRTAESLQIFYADGKERIDTYSEMTARILRLSGVLRYRRRRLLRAPGLLRCAVP